MSSETPSRPSFSLRQRWSIFFSVIISIAAVFALVVMMNYLGARYYMRFPWSMQSRRELSPETLSLLRSVTNDVNVIIYYDKKNLLYDYVKDLLDDYRLLNSRISVRTVDYLVDAGDALKVRDSFGQFMGAGMDTNVVIFSTASGTNAVPGEKLGYYQMDAVPNDTVREFRRKLEYFEGEREFNDAIYKVLNPKPPLAYFFENQNSIHHLDAPDFSGYQKFKAVLQANNIEVTNIASLPGTNGGPADCRLLIIAGPGVLTLTHADVDNVRRYLDQGGRLLVLLNHFSREYNTGLEAVLADWGVSVHGDTVHDLKNHYDESGNDVVVKSFNTNHPVSAHLQGLALQLALPRSVWTNANARGASAPTAQELAWTGTSAVIDDGPMTTDKPVPLMASVEKGDVRGINDQGTTRIVVVGDSFFLDNQWIGGGRNRAFAGYAVNWLLGQSARLQNVGPQKIHEYTIRLSPSESQSIRWIFLGAMPGGVLLLGGLVWLRRRR